MKPIFKWASLIGIACAVTAVANPQLAYSSDHLDGPNVKLDPTTDIADLYSFLDGNNVVFALTVFPQATAASKFSDAADYVIHTASAGAFGVTGGETDIICNFDTAQTIQCWVGSTEYLTGDASQTTGLTSASGNVKVFAGLRADPFFFNLDGFNNARQTVISVNPPLPLDEAGCPTVPQATSTLVVNELKTNPDGGGPPVDFFAQLNALAIVVSVDKSLVDAGGPIVAAWASTHKKT